MSRGRRERALAGPEPLNRERALARFRRLVGRNITLGFVAAGPIVEADTPEQLAEMVERALVAETGRQRPS
jgi:hypothetical protein